MHTHRRESIQNSSSSFLLETPVYRPVRVIRPVEMHHDKSGTLHNGERVREAGFLLWITRSNT